MRNDRSLLRVLSGEPVWPPPIWLMRQAGRSLPEYRETRAKAGSFLDLCYTPELAAEVTLQPIRRFGFDAAILFSDILVVPDAFGQKVSFVVGEGPRLDPVTSAQELARLSPTLPLERLAPVFETVSRVRADLPSETTLIGFCGAPWTVASYMIAGEGTPDQAPALEAWRNDRAFVSALIDRLVEGSIAYLVAQVDAGVDALQLFESHGGSLDAETFGPLSLEPLTRIVEGVRAARPGVPVIVFVRGVGPHLSRLVEAGIANGIGLDWGLRLPEVLPLVPNSIATQGNLHPDTLVAGGTELDAGIDAILSAVRGRPHVFNLGHGVLPETPIPHIERLVARVRGTSKS